MRHLFVLFSAVLAGCGPSTGKPVVTVAKPTATTLVGVTEVELDVVITGTGCETGAVATVSAGPFHAPLTPGTPVRIPVADLVPTPYADPTAPQSVSILVIPTCPLPEGTTHTGDALVLNLTLTAATAVAGDRPFEAAKVGRHWFDPGGNRLSYTDGSRLLLLDNAGNPAVSVTLDDVTFSGTAPSTRRLYPAGPAVGGALTFAAEAKGNDTATDETVVGARNAAGEVFHVTLTQDSASFGTAYAVHANAATKTIYAVLPNRRLIAATAAGVRWDAILDAGNFTATDVRLGAATGAAVRSAALANRTFTVRDFRTDGQPEGLPDTLSASGTVAAWDVANARFLWFFDDFGFHWYEPYTDDCAVPFPTGRKLSAPGGVPRFELTTSPGGTDALVFFATEPTGGGEATGHLLTVGDDCTPAIVPFPLAGLESTRPALYLANDGRAFAGRSNGATHFTAGLTAPAQTLPTHLASFAWRCGNGLCVFDGNGQPVLMPFAP